MNQPTPIPTTAPTSPAARLYHAPSMTARPTRLRRFRPRARSTPIRDRRSSASMPIRFTTRAAPAATTSALIPISSARMKTVLSVASLISRTFASVTRRGTLPPRAPTALRITGAAAFAASTLSRIPPGAEIRMMLIWSVPTRAWAVSSGANTTELSV